MANYPGSLDVLANPTSSTYTDDAGYQLDVVISTLNDIAEALEAKLGITLSAATTDDRLEGTAAGTTVWKKMSAARAYHNANQSIANATTTILALNSELFDNESIHSTVTNTSRLTAATAGKYLIVASVQFAANATGQRRVGILRNGSQTIARDWRDATAGGQPTDMTVTTFYHLAATEYVEIEVYQDSGGALNVVSAGQFSPELAMVRVAP